MADSEAAPGSIETAPPDGATPAVNRVASREWRSLVALLAVALLLYGFVVATVHRHAPERLEPEHFAQRTRHEAEWWLQHGMLDTAGLRVRPRADGTPYIYRSSTGVALWPAYAAQVARTTFGAQPDWFWSAHANLAFTLLTSLLLAWLGFRLARRLGVAPLPATLGAIAFLAVHFTFPDNLATYWEMSGRVPCLLLAAAFLLLDGRRVDGERRLSRWQAAAAFGLTFAEPFSGAFFLLAWTLVTLLHDEDPSRVRRVLLLGLAPAALAFGLYQAQLSVASARHPELAVEGSTLAFRTGLDGDLTYYRDHADLLVGRRPLVEAHAPKAPAGVFRAPVFFLAATAMSLLLLVLALQGRLPAAVTVTTFSLLGGYVLQGAVFSQALAIHPYYYDVLLYTPFALGLFAIAPALVRPRLARPGLAVGVALFCAVWMSFAQLREYAVQFPP
jgi:hypothetical protein